MPIIAPGDLGSAVAWHEARAQPESIGDPVPTLVTLLTGPVFAPDSQTQTDVARQPLLVDHGGGIKALHFDADALIRLSTFSSVTQPYTVFVVYAAREIVPDRYAVRRVLSGGNPFNFVNWLIGPRPENSTDNNSRHSVYTNINPPQWGHAASPTVASGGTHVHAVRHDTPLALNELNYFIDGVSVATVLNGTNGPGVIDVGGASFGEDAHANIMGIAVFNARLDDSEIAGVTEYFSQPDFLTDIPGPWRASLLVSKVLTASPAAPLRATQLVSKVLHASDNTPFRETQLVSKVLVRMGNPAMPLPCPIPDDAVMFDAEVDPVAPLVHTMAWATDTLIARSRWEQRRSLRRHPAHVLEFSVDAVTTKETSRIDALLQGGAPDGFRVPFWPDRIPLTAPLASGAASITLPTEGYSFIPGEQLILWSSPFAWETVEIDEVEPSSITFVDPTTNDWGSGTLIMPVKKGYLPDALNPSRSSRDGQATTLRFILCGWTYVAVAAPSTYLDYELLKTRPARLFDAAETVESFADVLESKAGAFATTWVSTEHPWERKFNWFCSTRAEIAAVRAFGHRRQGKYRSFWVPTWTADFLLLEPATAGATTFIVHDSGKDHVRHHVAIITVGAIYPRQIVGYTDNLDGTRTLEIDSAIPVDLAVDSTTISYLSLARFADDGMPMDFVAMDAAEVEIDWAETVPIPVPE